MNVEVHIYVYIYTYIYLNKIVFLSKLKGIYFFLGIAQWHHIMYL